MMENNFNKPREESAAEASGWDSLANVPFNGGETEAKAPEKLSEKLKASMDELNKAINAARGNVSREAFGALAAARGAMEDELREAQFGEAMSVIPEENREAFQAAKDDLSADEIVNGINMYADGKSMDEVKEYIVSQDWGGDNAETNTKRGEAIYDKLVSFITPKNAE